MKELLMQFISIFNNISLQNVVDILLITIIYYKILAVIKGTKAEQLVKGFLVILIALAFSEVFGLVALNWIVKSSLNFGLIAFIIIFQPEFRKMLEHLGQSTFTNIRKPNNSMNNVKHISQAVFDLSKDKVGALIILSRKQSLNEYIDKGTPIDGIITYALIMNAFVINTPLHDGALIIQDDRIKAGNCVLPLTEQNISHKYGTRHRAALGISEYSDAISIVVSEETGAISLCFSGVLKHYYTKESFEKDLNKMLATNNNSGISIGRRSIKKWSNIIRQK